MPCGRGAAELVAGFDPGPARTIFSTRDQGHARDRYFLESGGDIRFFFEEEAPDQLNKIGHALHDLDPVFDRVSRQPRLAAVAREIGLVEPLLLQSMYIFKQPGIGGEVGWHQDATYLYTTPTPSTGFWIALDDWPTADNGCLLALKGGPSRAGCAKRLPTAGDAKSIGPVDPTPWPAGPSRRARGPARRPGGAARPAAACQQRQPLGSAAPCLFACT
jgi:phytanoyl-CoA hydroxylase